MPAVLRYAGGLVAVALALAGCPVAASGEPPVGPQIVFIRSGDALPGDELLNIGAAGDQWRTLYRTPAASGAFGGLSWSGDGARLALTVGSGGFGAPFFSGIFALDAAGGRPQFVRGTRGGFGPVFSPDGTMIAFARARFFPRHAKSRRVYGSTSIWLVDAGGGNARRLTPWRKGVGIIPSSFSPDGSKLAAVRQRVGKSPEVVLVSLGGGEPELLAKNGVGPSYSPDGSTIAFVRPKRLGFRERFGPPRVPIWGGDVFLTAVDGSGNRRLTHTPSRLETRPNWDPSGERILFVQLPAKHTVRAQEGVGSSVIEMNADGSCRHRLLFTYGIAYSEAVWRPGPGREAGRIEC